MDYHYSGPKSVKFWKTVNKYNDDMLYMAGVILQDLEGRVLKMLANREDEPQKFVGPSRPKKPK